MPTSQYGDLKTVEVIISNIMIIHNTAYARNIKISKARPHYSLSIFLKNIPITCVFSS